MEIVVAVAFHDAELEISYVLSIPTVPGNFSRQHSDLMKRLEDQGLWAERFSFSDGFLTSRGRFVNRYEAMQIAKAVGQVRSDHPSTELTSPLLIPCS